jgi:hypothetical protein
LILRPVGSDIPSTRTGSPSASGFASLWGGGGPRRPRPPGWVRRPRCVCARTAAAWSRPFSSPFRVRAGRPTGGPGGSPAAAGLRGRRASGPPVPPAEPASRRHRAAWTEPRAPGARRLRRPLPARSARSTLPRVGAARRRRSRACLRRGRAWRLPGAGPRRSSSDRSGWPRERLRAPPRRGRGRRPASRRFAGRASMGGRASEPGGRAGSARFRSGTPFRISGQSSRRATAMIFGAAGPAVTRAGSASSDTYPVAHAKVPRGRRRPRRSGARWSPAVRSRRGAA